MPTAPPHRGRTRRCSTLGGAVGRVPRDATAYTGRDVGHKIVIDAAWLPKQEDTLGVAETAWARGLLDALQPHRAGVYVNFLDPDDDATRVRGTARPAAGGSSGCAGVARPASTG